MSTAENKAQWAAAKAFFNDTPDNFFGISGDYRKNTFEATNDYITFKVINNDWELVLKIELHLSDNQVYYTHRRAVTEDESVVKAIREAISYAKHSAHDVISSIEVDLIQLSHLESDIVYKEDEGFILVNLVDELLKANIDDIGYIIKSIVDITKKSNDNTVVNLGNQLEASACHQLALNARALRAHLVKSDETEK